MNNISNLNTWMLVGKIIEIGEAYKTINKDIPAISFVLETERVRKDNNGELLPDNQRQYKINCYGELLQALVNYKCSVSDKVFANGYLNSEVLNSEAGRFAEFKYQFIAREVHVFKDEV